MNSHRSHATKNIGLNFNWTICTFLIAAGFFMTGCSHKPNVSGIYKPVNDTSMIRALDFTSDGKVEVSSTLGNDTETYVVDGNQVKINDGKDTEAFTIGDDGSLDGGSDLGKFVKQ